MRARLPIAAGSLAVLAGCGVSLPLPTENRAGRVIPADSSYQMLATWNGMDGIADVLLTQGSGSQLFLLFSRGGTGTTPRGEVRAYPLTRPAPITGIVFLTLFNPVAMCSPPGRVFVLDQGDTCLARRNPATGRCDSTGGWDNRITDLSLYWRVREYGLLGGDTLSSFTDTTMFFVRGIAADAQGRIYVAGTALVYVVDPQSDRLISRSQQYRVYRYVRGRRYPLVTPPDRNMPGANWHRDTTWIVEEGSGIGTMVDPRGMAWNDAAGAALYAADRGKNWVQKLSDVSSSTGFFQLDGGQTGIGFNGPTDVAVDLAGFIYVADPGNRRVLRYGPDGTYIQTVNVERDADGEELQDPAAVAADDSLVYVGDAATGKVIRYKRRA